MPIELTRSQIDIALPKVKEGLSKYLWLQEEISNNQNAHEDPNFRRRFNHFYRVRRNAEWQSTFYGLMGRAKTNALGFNSVLDALHHATGRYEASFASKLIATIFPSEPVIDSVVLGNLGVALPQAGDPNRVSGLCQVHQRLKSLFDAYLKTKAGLYLVDEFKRVYPSARITEIKMLDLVLWQTRA